MAHGDADRVGLVGKRGKITGSRERPGKRLLLASDEVKAGMKVESDFLAKKSHDFRTPLNIIIGFTELMLDEVPGKINEEQRCSLNDILNSAKRLLELVNNMAEHS